MPSRQYHLSALSSICLYCYYFLLRHFDNIALQSLNSLSPLQFSILMLLPPDQPRQNMRLSSCADYALPDYSKRLYTCP
jgi:hypothetical protein